MEEQAAQNVVQAKPLYRQPFFYIVVFIFLLISLVTVLLLPASKNTTQGDRFETGIATDSATVAVPNDLVRYPLNTNEVGNNSVNWSIFESLVIYRKGELVPGLAVSWTNPDNLTWRFELRKGVKFHSGDTFTANDVKYTIEQAKASSTSTPTWVSNSASKLIKTVTVVDDNTIDLVTTKPNATLLYSLAFIPMLSQAQVTRDGLAKAVGTGPYTIVTFEKKQVVLEANESYWTTKAKVKTLTYTVLSDPTKVTDGLRRGTIGVATVKEATASSLAKQGFQSTSVQNGNIAFLAFDINSDKAKYVDSPTNPFKNVKVRQAVQLALDPALIIKNAKVEGAAVKEFTTSALLGFNDSIIPVVRNVDQAKALLTEAGFASGFTVTLDAQKSNSAVVNEIKKQLAEVNIKVTLNLLDSTPFFDKLIGVDKKNTGDYSLIVANLRPISFDSADYLSLLFSSTGASNTNHYMSADVEALLDKAKSSFKVRDRSDITKQIHAKVMADLPAVPLYTQTNSIVTSRTLHFEKNPVGVLLGYEISGRRLVTGD